MGMYLLGAKNYDPSTAVSKSTATLLAMTAFDTTNLRLAITVPASGIIRVRMRCALVEGATTNFPSLLMGAMNGATVLGRQAPIVSLPTAFNTDYACLDVDFTVTGLTPGAMNIDAAYAVQVVVAATNIKYGGPDNATGANAWGGFLFEIYDPQYIKADLDTIKTKAVTCAANVTVNANVGMTQPVNFTGTGSSALVQTDVVDFVGNPAAALGPGIPLVDVNLIDGVHAAAANLSAAYAGFETGTAQAGGASTITLRSGASAIDNFFKDQVVYILSGTGAGQTNRITSYVGSTKVATVETAWATQPTNTSVYLILGRVG